MIFFLGVASVYGQAIEVTPLVGGIFGGSVKLQEEGQPNFHASLGDGVSFGLSLGYRFDQEDCAYCGVVAFRWMRQDSHINLLADPGVPGVTAVRAGVTYDHFLGDFTHEWQIDEAQKVRPFVTATLGVAVQSTPFSNAARFAFGIGTGFKVAVNPRWGMRFQVEYLGIVQSGEVQTLACVGGGCVLVLQGAVTNRFQVSLGPDFHF